MDDPSRVPPSQGKQHKVQELCGTLTRSKVIIISPMRFHILNPLRGNEFHMLVNVEGDSRHNSPITT
ncbi:hypothetical protein CR513_11236, partial [Mucuna pruriens]